VHASLGLTHDRDHAYDPDPENDDAEHDDGDTLQTTLGHASTVTPDPPEVCLPGVV